MENGSDKNNIAMDDATLKEFLVVINKINKFVELEIRDGIGEVYINNPPRNYINQQVIDEFLLMQRILDEIEQTGKFHLRGLIVSGRGKRTFSAGASLDMLGQVKDPEVQENIRVRGRDLSNALENFHVPVIAAINGICLGAGLEAALACHYRVCAKNVHLGFPEILLGFIPGAGGTQRLPRLIGRSNAQYLILSGKLITAEEALEYGIVNKVVDKNDVMIEARKIAEEMCSKDPRATRAALKAINAGINEGIDVGLEVEGQVFWKLVNERMAKGSISNEDVSMNFGKKKEQNLD